MKRNGWRLSRRPCLVVVTRLVSMTGVAQAARATVTVSETLGAAEPSTVTSATVPRPSTERAGAAGLQIRPAEVGITGDGTGYLGGFNGKRALKLTRHSGSAPFGSLTWTRWLRGRASAKGAIWVNDGIPDDAHGTFHRFTAAVLAFRPRDGIFTRMRVVWLNAGNTGHAHVITYRAKHYRGLDREPGYWMWT